MDKDFDEGFCDLYKLNPYAKPGLSHSHVHLIYAENSEFIAAKAGSYEFKFKITDQLGNGWSGSKAFEVK